MADALKAEGNKAFSAKDYATAVYVSFSPGLPRLQKRLGGSQPWTAADWPIVRSSPKLSKSSPQTTFSTPTARLSTPRNPNTRRLSRMPTRLRISRRTGRRDGSARVPLTVV
ncbi:hypothetical protein BO83DRAFT_383174 [Aspergillus eucalypticola CBS 122712]|uniref:Uncharacterized protein n=1 Tax=Aspergillus eucalypticola (strain CBS 122712 / IBT 29274) TaxID=1448314 RepID=A0A317URT2_ASPEC|nr:uncharacterized protein BO83DRAFT_383174 [Aspergillus eucalypticola CBS 122712]PWY62750.1 hypothetical protein BO83DRAFT_383174 [Aspergillus eucalypticola CBS 122712]